MVAHPRDATASARELAGFSSPSSRTFSGTTPPDRGGSRIGRVRGCFGCSTPPPRDNASLRGSGDPRGLRRARARRCHGRSSQALAPLRGFQNQSSMARPWSIETAGAWVHRRGRGDATAPDVGPYFHASRHMSGYQRSSSISITSKSVSSASLSLTP